MKSRFLVVLFLVAYVQNAKGSKNKKTGSRIGKLASLCALHCASNVLSTDFQAEMFHIRNVKSQQGGQCYFEGCYCPHDIITRGAHVTAFFNGTADDIYNKYCHEDEYHDNMVDEVSRFSKTLRFCRRLIQKAGTCLEKMFHLPQDPNVSKGDLVTELISLKSKSHPQNLSYWNLSDEVVEDYWNDQSTTGIFCKELGPESCNCSCTYRVHRKVSALDATIYEKRDMPEFETKETEGNLTDDSYEVIAQYTSTDFKGTKSFTFSRTQKDRLKREDL